MHKKKRPSQRRIEVPSAIVVEHPNRVTNPLLRAFREALGNNSIAFEEVSLARGEVKFELSGSSIRAVARDNYAVFPLLQLQVALFWLGGALIFERKLGNYRLKSISLVIFKGDAFDDRKTALFRAEWDDPDSATIHAQPHWHVYPRPIESKVNVMEDANLTREVELLDFGTDQASPEDPRWKTASNFHYAMSARWAPDGVGHHRANLSEIKEIVRWIKSCIGYSRDQLRWLFT